MFYYLLRIKNYIQCYTEDLKSRFEQHCKGLIISTKQRRPLELIYSNSNKKDAMHGEKYLKTYHGKLFLKNRLKSYFTG